MEDYELTEDERNQAIRDYGQGLNQAYEDSYFTLHGGEFDAVARAAQQKMANVLQPPIAFVVKKKKWWHKKV